MFRILFVAKIDIPQNIDDVEFVKYNNADSFGYCDVVIFDKRSLDVLEVIDFGSLCDNEEISKIILIEDGDDKSEFQHLNFDAFLQFDSFVLLGELLLAMQSKIIAMRKISLLKKEIAKNNILSEANNSGLDLIKKSTRDATEQIESNFESCIDALREVFENTQDDADKNKLSFAINSLRKYILILQFEDEVFQLIDGMKETNNDRLVSGCKYGVNFSDEEKLDFRKYLASFYTTQDQRDAVLGISTKRVEDGELTFF